MVPLFRPYNDQREGVDNQPAQVQNREATAGHHQPWKMTLCPLGALTQIVADLFRVVHAKVVFTRLATYMPKRVLFH